MRAFTQEQEASQCREVRSVAGVSDINGRSKRIRNIGFGLPQGANAPTRLKVAGRFVVAQKPGLESSSI